MIVIVDLSEGQHQGVCTSADDGAAPLFSLSDHLFGASGTNRSPDIRVTGRSVVGRFRLIGSHRCNRLDLDDAAYWQRSNTAVQRHQVTCSIANEVSSLAPRLRPHRPISLHRSTMTPLGLYPRNASQSRAGIPLAHPFDGNKPRVANTASTIKTLATRVIWGLAPVAVLATMLSPDNALAQPTSPPPPRPAAAEQSAPPSSRASSRSADRADERRSDDSAPSSRRGKKVISLDDDFLVEGQLEKPSAFYVLRRSTTDHDWARLDALFTPLVLDAVQDPLF